VLRPCEKGTIVVDVLEEGSFDVDEFRDELDRATSNRQLGSWVLFENDRVRVWEVRLEPGERGSFHLHDRQYFWTVVEGGIGKQRSPDGTYKLRRYETGDTSFQANSPDDAMIHDFENAGDGVIRFITVELLD
jgi:beta-alanine degradation protein BauB